MMMKFSAHSNESKWHFIIALVLKVFRMKYEFYSTIVYQFQISYWKQKSFKTIAVWLIHVIRLVQQPIFKSKKNSILKFTIFNFIEFGLKTLQQSLWHSLYSVSSDNCWNWTCIQHHRWGMTKSIQRVHIHFHF